MKNQKLQFEHIEDRSIGDFAEMAYLNYSMYVILDRALPQLGDGLKPVQRRIIYAMSDLGLSASSKPKKSARTIGDVIGKFHPHGDSACYEAMVNMAQEFSYRYPLIDGQGNWGSQDDPKSFAAMRYTEAKLTKYASTLLSELDEGTVDWQGNFDGTLEEPKLLPAKLPNLLLNGGSGIAVGMATDLPSHNLNEVLNGLIALIDDPDLPLKQLLKIIPGPDFASGGEIVSSKHDIENIYATGTGSLKLRAKFQLEKNNIIITELPYQTSGAKIIEQIAGQMIAKKLPVVTDLRDESDHENACRIVLNIKSKEIHSDSIISHLCATTDLERNIRVNLNIINLEGLPQVFDLKTLCLDWLRFRISTLKRRYQNRLDKVEARLHILEGLLIIYLNIDEVIRIIRNEDHPQAVLMSQFKLSEIQANSILELRLKYLAKLEEIKITGEQKNLKKEARDLKKILQSKELLNSALKDELIVLIDLFGDPRRTQIKQRELAEAISEKQIISKDPSTLIVSNKGWVRLAKGHDINHETLAFKADDSLLELPSKGHLGQDAVFLDQSGRAYSILANQLPSARGFGEPLSSIFKVSDGTSFVTGTLGEPGEDFIMASTAGYGFIVEKSDLFSRSKAGRAVMNVPGNHKMLPLRRVKSKDDIIFAISSDFRGLVFPVSELPKLSKGKGNKIIGLPKKELLSLSYLFVLSPKENLCISSGKRLKKWSYEQAQDLLTSRGRRGISLKIKVIENAFVE